MSEVDEKARRLCQLMSDDEEKVKQCVEALKAQGGVEKAIGLLSVILGGGSKEEAEKVVEEVAEVVEEIVESETEKKE